MRKRLAAFVLTFAVILLAMCGCVGQPYAERVISSSSNATDSSDNNLLPPIVTTRKLYVSGAVERDGYVDIPLVTDRKTVLEIVGVAPCAAIPVDANVPLSAYLQEYIVNFVCDGVECQSVNVNSPYVSARQTFEGVDDRVIGKLADYISQHGAITNRDQLRLALDGDYDDNYYKFYIDVSDYA